MQSAIVASSSQPAPSACNSVSTPAKINPAAIGVLRLPMIPVVLVLAPVSVGLAWWAGRRDAA